MRRKKHRGGPKPVPPAPPVEPEKKTRSDLLLEIRAAKLGWDVPPGIRTELVATMAEVVMGEIPAGPRERIRAFEAILKMTAQGQPDSNFAKATENPSDNNVTVVIEMPNNGDVENPAVASSTGAHPNAEACARNEWPAIGEDGSRGDDVGDSSAAT